MSASHKNPIRLNASDILLLASKARPHIADTFTLSTYSMTRKYPSISSNTLYMRVGRCVIKIELQTTRIIAKEEQVTILRNMLIALAVCQRFMRKIKKSDLGDLPQKRVLSGIIAFEKTKYQKLTWDVMIRLLNQSQVLEGNIYFAFPRVISLPFSPSVESFVSSILGDFEAFTAWFMTLVKITPSVQDVESVDISPNLIAPLYDYVRSCALRTSTHL